MKIAYFVHCFPPAKGGLEFLSGEIVKILREAGHEVHVFTGKGQTLDSYKTFSNWVDESDDDEYIHRLPLNFFWQRLTNKFLYHFVVKFGVLSPWYFGPLLKFGEREEQIIKKCDLIFGAGMPTMMFYKAYTYAKRFNKRLILHPSYHDVRYYNNVPFFQKAISYANKVILQTPLEEKRLAKNYKLRPKQVLRLTYSGLSRDMIANKKAIISRQATNIQNKILQNKKITLGFVGQISTRKNYQILVKLLELFLKEPFSNNIKIQFLFAGVATNTSFVVEDMFDEYQDNVRFIYNFSKPKEVYNQIDIFINPSREESLGLVNFEAMFNLIPTFVDQSSAFASLIDCAALKYNTVKDLHDGIINIIHSSVASKTLLINRQLDFLSIYTTDNYKNKLINNIN